LAAYFDSWLAGILWTQKLVSVLALKKAPNALFGSFDGYRTNKCEIFNNRYSILLKIQNQHNKQIQWLLAVKGKQC